MCKQNFKIVFVLGFFLLTLTGWNNVEATSTNTLKIKGLYMGMHIDKVPNILRTKLPKKYKVTKVKKSIAQSNGETLYSVAIYKNNIEAEDNRDLLVLAREDKKVMKIVIQKTLSDAIFNSSGVNAETFRINFMKAYNIPSMTFTRHQFYMSYEYVNTSGIKVTILYGTKDIIIEDTNSVAFPLKAKQMNFN